MTTPVSSKGSEAMIFNFITWAARSPLKYYPYSSAGIFFHKGYHFRIVRERLQGRYSYTQESLHIMVLWPSTKPARALIEEAREFCVSESISSRSIYRPMVNTDRQRTYQWHIATTRPSRPLSTVVLDDQQKAEIVTGMNEFLLPKSVI
jgi:chaperone BCS1